MGTAIEVATDVDATCYRQLFIETVSA